MIKPAPCRFRCPKCGWKKIFAPESDVLSELPPESCEKCGHAPLDCEDVSGFLTSLREIMVGKGQR